MVNSRVIGLAGALFGAIAGCAEPSHEPMPIGDSGGIDLGESDGGAEADGGAAEAGDGEGGGGGGGGDSDPLFDVGDGGADQAEDGGNESGCQRVDVILAVDNSGSMGEEIEALQGPVFDALPDALLSVNGGIEDFHLAVIDACPKPAFFHDEGLSGVCDYSTGANYMSSDSPALAAEFSCVTQFATDGYSGSADECLDSGAFNDDDEQAGLTAAAAIGPDALMAANAGFLRDDALLFVVAITDEDESLVDSADVQAIHDAIVDAKGNDPAAVAYLGVAGAGDCDGPYGSAEDAVNARALSELFEADGHGMFWDICSGSLEDAFAQAIAELVDPACGGFNPVG